MVPPFIYLSLAEKNSVSQVNFFGKPYPQLDIVKFALPFEKISFHPIFAVVGKQTNFFMSGQAASRPYAICVRRVAPVHLSRPVLENLKK
ncbi:hypothetical protein CIRMBP1197_00635 [Enterococcus cecorum]|nr:hypothetical protein CIRMBP1197_00635 [Enterococcus cecorum]CAI3455283.1 hypothetical protein CIRMBP1320_01453 [Enterococcus cecorum]